MQAALHTVTWLNKQKIAAVALDGARDARDWASLVPNSTEEQKFWFYQTS